MSHLIIAIMADGLVPVVLLIACVAFLVAVPRRERYDRYTRILMAGVTSYLAAKLIGTWWQPEHLRPFEQLKEQAGAAYLNNPGFPSDHVLLATFLTFAVWYATGSKRLAAVMAVLTVAIGVGRVLALVHTPLDVAGGLVIGAIGIIWYPPVIRGARKCVKLPARLVKRLR